MGMSTSTSLFRNLPSQNTSAGEHKTTKPISYHEVMVKRDEFMASWDPPNIKLYKYELVVSTHLKNMNQIGSFPQIGVKINTS